MDVPQQKPRLILSEEKKQDLKIFEHHIRGKYLDYQTNRIICEGFLFININLFN